MKKKNIIVKLILIMMIIFVCVILNADVSKSDTFIPNKFGDSSNSFYVGKGNQVHIFQGTKDQNSSWDNRDSNGLTIPDSYYCMNHELGISHYYYLQYNTAQNKDYFDFGDPYKIAYIFNSSENDYVKQMAYWLYQGNTITYKNYADYGGISYADYENYAEKGKSLYEKATNYSKNRPSIKSNSAYPTVQYLNGSYWYGPFNITYTSSISSFTMNMLDESGNSTQFYLANCYDRVNGTKLSKIVSGQDFYIKANKSDYNNLKITYKTVKSATYKKYISSTSGKQPLMKPTITMKDVDVSIPINKLSYNIKLHKIGERLGDLSNVSFKIEKVTRK